MRSMDVPAMYPETFLEASRMHPPGCQGHPGDVPSVGFAWLGKGGQKKKREDPVATPRPLSIVQSRADIDR